MEPTAAPATPAAAPQPVATSYESNPFKLFQPAWEALKVNFTTIVIASLIAGAAFLALFIVPVIALAVASSSHSQGLLVVGIILTIAAVIAGIYLMMRFMGASTWLVLASVRNQKRSFKETWEGGQPYGVRVFLYLLLYMLICAGGFILFVVPGIIFSVWYSMGMLAIVDENLSVGAALSRSKQLVSGRFWEIFGVQSVPQVVQVVNVIPIFGAIASTIAIFVYSFALPIRYLGLKDYKENNKPFPPVSKWNFAAFAAAVIVIILSIVLSVLAGQAETTTNPY